MIFRKSLAEHHRPPTYLACKMRAAFQTCVPFKVTALIDLVFALSFPPAIDSLTDGQLLGINFYNFLTKKLVDRTQEPRN